MNDSTATLSTPLASSGGPTHAAEERRTWWCDPTDSLHDGLGTAHEEGPAACSTTPSGLRRAADKSLAILCDFRPHAFRCQVDLDLAPTPLTSTGSSRTTEDETLAPLTPARAPTAVAVPPREGQQQNVFYDDGPYDRSSTLSAQRGKKASSFISGRIIGLLSLGQHAAVCLYAGQNKKKATRTLIYIYILRILLLMGYHDDTFASLALHTHRATSTTPFIKVASLHRRCPTPPHRPRSNRRTWGLAQAPPSIHPSIHPSISVAELSDHTCGVRLVCQERFVKQMIEEDNNRILQSGSPSPIKQIHSSNNTFSYETFFLSSHALTFFLIAYQLHLHISNKACSTRTGATLYFNPIPFWFF
eukprot:gene1652-1020_t